MKLLAPVVCSFCVGLTAAAFAADRHNQWPSWRGPLQNGVAPQAKPPVAWSENQNIKWKAQVPGFGTSTPVIWGDQVFILSAVKAGDGAGNADSKLHEFKVISYDRNTGKQRWEKVAVQRTPHEGHHQDHGYASASPITDGEVLLAYFGSRGLHCFDLQGTPKWSKEFGQMRTRNSFGEGASPALHGDTVVVVWDDETENDFIIAMDRKTGKERWRQARNEATGWTTPFIVEHDGKHQVIVNAPGKVRSYDLETGKELWQAGGQTGNSIPMPVASVDTVYVTSGFRGNALFAIALGHEGDLTGSEAIRWSYQKNTPYVPSPLLIDNLLFTVTRNDGLLTCFDAKTGQPHFEAQRLEGVTGVYASPVAADGKIYVLGRNGLCLVLKQGPGFEVLSRNKLDDRTDASIALVGNELFIRGHANLYCVTEAK